MAPTTARAARLLMLEPAMGEEDLAFHRQREQHCRELAEHATNPEVRRRHEELAKMHGDIASRSSGEQH